MDVRQGTGPYTSTRVSSVSVRRIDDCKFEVNWASTYTVSIYSVDFAPADLAAAHPTEVPNKFGRPTHAIVIPGAHYCVAAGRPYINPIPVGTCADTFAAEPTIVNGDDKMLAAIHRLKTFCTPKVS
jgi:hypothetical protein